MNHERLKYLSDTNGYKILPVKPGMQIELHEKVGEGSTERIWKFKGLVIKVKKPGCAD
jgi:ribosomal protein L19